MSCSVSALILGVLFVVVLPALVLLVQWGIRRWWPSLADGDQNELVGFIIAVVGVIYAVLPAFVVIVAWENFTSAERIVGQEASTLRGIYLSGGVSVAPPSPSSGWSRTSATEPRAGSGDGGKRGVRRRRARAGDQHRPGVQPRGVHGEGERRLPAAVGLLAV